MTHPPIKFTDEAFTGTFEWNPTDRDYIGYVSEPSGPIRMVKVSEYATEAQLRMVFDMVVGQMSDFNKIAERNRQNAEKLRKERLADNEKVKDNYGIEKKPKAPPSNDRNKK